MYISCGDIYVFNEKKESAHKNRMISQKSLVFPYTQKSVLYFRKSPVLPHESPMFSPKEPCISAKVPDVSVKEPYIAVKKPCIFTHTHIYISI